MKKIQRLLVFTTTFLLAAALHRTRSVRADSSEDVGQYVGPQTCMECHDDMGLPFQRTIHGRLAGFELKGEPGGCESYHGPGQAHAEKQGPFTFEHAPVVEDCTICHEPHGTVANHLQRQTEPFLCLQCHLGHEDSHHLFYSDSTWHLSGYSKCTQCLSQIHGSDFPTFSGHGRLIR